MSKILYTNKIAGARVGHRTVFTVQGAINLYMVALEVVYAKLDVAGAGMLANMEMDMVNNCKMNIDDIEAMETKYLQSL